MKKVAVALLLTSGLMWRAHPQAQNPYLGRWDITLTQAARFGATWLGVSENNGKLDVLFQNTEGHVAPVEDVKFQGPHLTMVVSPASTKNGPTVWELDLAGGRITGVQRRGEQTVGLVGVRAPDLKRNPPATWSDPVPLFNGKNLDGWQPVGNSGETHWLVRDGVLVNEEHGVNIKTSRSFDDFKVHFEVNCPERANSGFYLRGRYEVQIAGGPGSAPAAPATSPAAGRAGSGRGYNLPPNRSMGAVYGRLAPAVSVSTPGDGWDIFDITLVGRTVTVVRNGVTTIDRKEIEGITGGALDANEGEPGPFYIQGDHTGNVKFRNITISLPKS
jgi:hypothetical protein